MPQDILERLRMRLGRPDALAPLAGLAVLSGLLTGAVVLSFRLLTEVSVTALLGLEDAEAFESLDLAARLLVPLTGALLVGLLFERAGARHTDVGIVHVMDRLADFRADLPWRNAVMQYGGALLCLSSGQSMGREGPGVHLGAAVSSLVGRLVQAPNNSMRTLIACGTAASIAACFNTPIAGVIFAMEVVMLEYTIVGFMPVIISAVVAAWMARAAYGHAAAFDVPPLGLASLYELPFLVFVGVAMGTLAAIFVTATSALRHTTRGMRTLWRFALAGTATGLCAAVVPQVMGIGYDTVDQCLINALPLGLLAAIVVAKLLASTACVALGLPAGLIGPTLVMGATAGAALGQVGHALMPELSASPGLYAMLGMGAMMGATLKAPLAALMAILELTANVNIILPGMVCIVSANLTCTSLFGRDSIFIAALRERGVEYFTDPVALALSRAAVSTRMRTDFTSVPRQLGRAEGAQLCAGAARWLVITEPQGPRALLHVEALHAHLEASTGSGDLDLLGAALPRHSTATVSARATLQEARQAFTEQGVETLCVMRKRRGRGAELCGILTRSQLTD